MFNIKLKNIEKTYDKSDQKVIDDVSVDIDDGEFFVLVGPSGSGKSTLLRMIAGLETIDDGYIFIGDKIVNEMPPKDRNITMVFQNYALYPNMTVKENILFGLDIKKISKQEQEKRLKETSEMVGLTNYLQRKPAELSGGQRQRVALARSICSDAPIFLMDEPLSNLDAKLRGDMRNEIRAIQRELKKTMIYVTHDQLESMTMGDRIMVLNNGKISQVGTPKELYNNPHNLFTATFIGNPRMNTVPAKHQDGQIILADTIHVSLNERQIQSLPDKTEFVVGVRPEHIFFADQNYSTSVSIEIKDVEFLGNETQVIFDISGYSFIAKWSGQWALEPGARLQIALNSDYFHIFDNQTEDLIRGHVNLADDSQPKADGGANV